MHNLCLITLILLILTFIQKNSLYGLFGITGGTCLPKRLCAGDLAFGGKDLMHWSQINPQLSPQNLFPFNKKLVAALTETCPPSMFYEQPRIFLHKLSVKCSQWTKNLAHTRSYDETLVFLQRT